MNILRELYQGNRPLWEAYWGVGICGGLIISGYMMFMFEYAKNFGVYFNVANLLFILLVIVIDTYWVVSVSRCAHDVKWKGWRVVGGIGMSVALLKHIVILGTLSSLLITG